MKKRFSAFFTQKKVSPMFVIGMILLVAGAIPAAMLAFFGEFSVIAYYFLIPGGIIGMVIAMITFGKHVRGSELDEHMNNMFDLTKREFDSKFKLGRTETEVVRFPACSWVFTKDDVTARRVSDGIARSQYFYTTVVAITSIHLNIFTRIYSLYEEAPITEEKHSVLFSEINDASFKDESRVFPATGTVTQHYLQIETENEKAITAPIIDNAIIDGMLTKIKSRISAKSV